VSGEPGELFVRGPMAMGAWRGGAMVAGPFQPDPEDAASRVYNMGDLVRQRADGLFEFVGRKDRQVKIRGQWANLGEIEAAMRGMDGVADATVVAVSHPDEGDRLAAFLVMTPDVAAPTGGTVRRVVAAETAEHMAPATVMFLDAIPRLANLKTDLVRLTALAQG
jgi:acyl-coenzyme A synthetase/AMP-(fatty) acid ligase